MCGIVCVYNPDKKISLQNLKKITASLNHRGPDANKVVLEKDGRLGIGHTRLTLVDLSSKANQPMILDNCILSFNGEIYNFRILSDELKNKYQFQTKSDSELIIRAIQHWGIKNALRKFNGCFAFAFYDKIDQKLYLVRDRIGEKQIVYSRAKNGDWVFASEIKALLNHPEISKEPNIDRFLSDLIFKFFSDKKEAYFKNIFNLPPGHYFCFDLKSKKDPQLFKYWDIETVDEDNTKNQDFLFNLKSLFEDSVDLIMDADVKIGSIVSGGLDSSMITALALHKHSDKYKDNLTCITTKYDHGTDLDLKKARLLKRYLGKIDLHETLVDSDIKIKDIDDLTFCLEEPLLDKVYFAQFMNYKKAHDLGLRAVINGQGADELWLGYFYFYNLFRLPLSEINFDGLLKYWFNDFEFCNLFKKNQAKNKIKSLIISNLEKNFLPNLFQDKLKSLTSFSVKTHLQSMLAQEDRLSMANSVEVRLPHVDHRIVTAALSLPSKFKICHGIEKYPLRRIAQNFLPKEISNRKKFAFPDPPLMYDRKIEDFFDVKDLLASPIISEIFEASSLNKESFSKLPIRSRWKLFSILRMEKVYFD